MLLNIHPDNPNERNLKIVNECLLDGGVIIYPTDTVYGMGCNIYKPKAIERIARIRNVKLEKANFSFICYDLSHLSDFTKQISTPTFKLMKRALPGPFTFILPASNNVPKIFQSNKKTIGIRIPDNNVAREIVQRLGNPIMNTSIYDDDDVIEYTTDPELIYEKYSSRVDLVINGGYGDNTPSTVVDCTDDEFQIIRQGKGILENFL